jgi:hypothetical protein
VRRERRESGRAGRIERRTGRLTIRGGAGGGGGRSGGLGGAGEGEGMRASWWRVEIEAVGGEGGRDGSGKSMSGGGRRSERSRSRRCEVLVRRRSERSASDEVDPRRPPSDERRCERGGAALRDLNAVARDRDPDPLQRLRQTRYHMMRNQRSSSSTHYTPSSRWTRTVRRRRVDRRREPAPRTVPSGR